MSITLFLYINDILTISLPCSHSLTLYADDILFSYPFKPFDDQVLTLYLLIYDLGIF